MKGFEWLLEEPDLNGLITNVHMKRFPAHRMQFDVDMLLIDCVAKFAVEKNNSVLLRFALDHGFNKYTALAQSLMDISLIACEFVFVDAGLSIHGNCWQSSKKLVECRNRARFAAILIMRAMQEMRKGYKNVSIIISRAIWESRGQIDEWLKNEGV